MAIWTTASNHKKLSKDLDFIRKIFLWDGFEMFLKKRNLRNRIKFIVTDQHQSPISVNKHSSATLHKPQFFPKTLSILSPM